MESQYTINQIAHDYKYYILIACILGIIAIIPTASADTVQITIIPGAGSSDYCSATDTCYTPSILNISPGDTVTWANDDNVGHTVTNGLPYRNQTEVIFDSGMIPPGKTYSFTFQDSGTYKYFCKIDKWMVGEVIVGPSQSSPTVPEFGTLAELVVLISIIGVVILSRTMKSSLETFKP